MTDNRFAALDLAADEDFVEAARLDNLPDYVYVASSWRNPVQQDVVAALRAASINCYDFRNPPGGHGFSWREVKPGPPEGLVEFRCSLARGSFGVHASHEHTVAYHGEPSRVWCDGHPQTGVAAKGSDWEPVDEYLAMVAHPRAVEGYAADFAAMERADTFVMVLPCGKSAHLEIGYAIGAGKRTAILLEDPVEPELMYRGADLLARNLDELLAWMGVER